jgi:hypothetical protein
VSLLLSISHLASRSLFFKTYISRYSLRKRKELPWCNFRRNLKASVILRPCSYRPVDLNMHGSISLVVSASCIIPSKIDSFACWLYFSFSFDLVSLRLDYQSQTGGTSLTTNLYPPLVSSIFLSEKINTNHPPTNRTGSMLLHALPPCLPPCRLVWCPGPRSLFSCELRAIEQARSKPPAHHQSSVLNLSSRNASINLLPARCKEAASRVRSARQSDSDGGSKANGKQNRVIDSYSNRTSFDGKCLHNDLLMVQI